MQTRTAICQLIQLIVAVKCDEMYLLARSHALHVVHKYMFDADAQVGGACLDPQGPPQGASLQRGRTAGR